MAMEGGYIAQKKMLLAEPIFVLYYLMEGFVSVASLARNRLDRSRRGFELAGPAFLGLH